MSNSPSPHPDRWSRKDRRRQAWFEFRQAYPTFLKVCSGLFLFLLALNIWLGYRRVAYTNEIARLRADMTQGEREKSDLVIQSERDKVRMALELARRQARWEPTLHLSVSVDSGVMYLERDGARLRTMAAVVTPNMVPGDDSLIPTLPKGERTIDQVVRDSGSVVTLNDGLRIYAGAKDTATVSGGIRISAGDMKAIIPNLVPGMLVYFY